MIWQHISKDQQSKSFSYILLSRVFRNKGELDLAYHYLLTAEKEAIDTAMKLGTNYPNGPFEFVELFGLDMVYKQLLSLGKDTGEERYRICSLLKQEYLRSGL